ncbi:hypothetical protein ACHQM5_026760 [Ranunculus cassubicifolius]
MFVFCFSLLVSWSCFLSLPSFGGLLVELCALFDFLDPVWEFTVGFYLGCFVLVFLASCPCSAALFLKFPVDVCFLCCLLSCHQSFEAISLASGRILRLRSAPTASPLRTHRLRSAPAASVAKLTRYDHLLLTSFRPRHCSDTVILTFIAQLLKDHVGSLNEWSHLCISLGFSDFPKEKCIPLYFTCSSLLMFRYSLEKILLRLMLYCEGQCDYLRAQVLQDVKEGGANEALLISFKFHVYRTLISSSKL